jgi:hypothetical protein
MSKESGIKSKTKTVVFVGDDMPFTSKHEATLLEFPDDFEKKLLVLPAQTEDKFSNSLKRLDELLKTLEGRQLTIVLNGHGDEAGNVDIGEGGSTVQDLIKRISSLESFPKPNHQAQPQIAFEVFSCHTGVDVARTQKEGKDPAITKRESEIQEIAKSNNFLIALNAGKDVTEVSTNIKIIDSLVQESLFSNQLQKILIPQTFKIFLGIEQKDNAKKFNIPKPEYLLAGGRDKEKILEQYKNYFLEKADEFKKLYLEKYGEKLSSEEKKRIESELESFKAYVNKNLLDLIKEYFEHLFFTLINGNKVEQIDFYLGLEQDIKLTDKAHKLVSSVYSWGWYRCIDSTILLVKKGLVDVNQKDKFGETPLQAILKLSDLNVITESRESGEIGDNVKNSKVKKTPIADVIIELIDRGADVNVKDSDGKTPLDYALRRIIDKDGNPLNDEDAIREVGKITSALLSKGAKIIDTVNEFGRTPLHYLAMQGLLLETKELLKMGYDPRLRDNRGKTPSDYAQNNQELKQALELAEKSTTDEEKTAQDTRSEDLQESKPARFGVITAVITTIDNINERLTVLFRKIFFRAKTTSEQKPERLDVAVKQKEEQPKPSREITEQPSKPSTTRPDIIGDENPETLLHDLIDDETQEAAGNPLQKTAKQIQDEEEDEAKRRLAAGQNSGINNSNHFSSSSELDKTKLAAISLKMAAVLAIALGIGGPAGFILAIGIMMVTKNIANGKEVTYVSSANQMQNMESPINEDMIKQLTQSSQSQATPTHQASTEADKQLVDKLGGEVAQIDTKLCNQIDQLRAADARQTAQTERTDEVLNKYSPRSVSTRGNETHEEPSTSR